MAKFKDINILLQEEQRILFGDDSLGVYGPAEYPAIDLGSEKPFMGYTTISGYNTTLPGSGTTVIPEVDEMVMSVPLAGERATEDYHLVRYDQMLDFMPDYNHGDLIGLDNDDHLQYVLTDGSRGFTSTVSGVYPVEDYHLVTKEYVADQINTISGTVYEELTNYVTLNSDQTISGSKTFEGDTIFNGGTTFNETMTVNSGINYGDSTISGTGDIYTGNIYADNQKWGRTACVDGNRDQAIVFGTAWPDDDYTVVVGLTNEEDDKPSIYSIIQGAKTGTGFIIHFSGKIDSSDFVLEWHAFYGQKN